MLSSDFIISKYPTFNIFNIVWDKYTYTPIDFMFDNDWKKICNPNKILTLINELDNILFYESKTYKLSNGVYIYINDKKQLLKQTYSNMTYGLGENAIAFMKCLFQKMINIAKHNNITLLDAFICTNFYFSWNKINDNSDVQNDIYNKLDDETKNLYKVISKYTISEINNKYNEYYDNLYDMLKTINDGIKENPVSVKYDSIGDLVIDNDVINKLKEVIYLLASIISHKIAFVGSCKVSFDDNTCDCQKIIVKELDEDILNNIFYILYINDKDILTMFFNDIFENTKNELVLYTFIRLISKQSTFDNLFNKHNINDLKYKYQTLFKTKSDHVYKLAELDNKHSFSKIVDDKEVPDVKQERLDDNPFFITNHQYYIERDSFNKDYKRKYKCIKTINNINGNKLNIVIMKQVSGPDTIGYKINEYDCKYLGIKYQPNLEVFNSEGIKWIKCQGNKKLYN